MSYTQLLYQIVFSTKKRQRTLSKNNRDQLFKYITGILKNKNCHLYCINGVEDHIHILTHIHQSIAISSIVKDIKVASSKWIKENHIFQNFDAWQEKYGVFTYSIRDKHRLIYYIENQENHHRKQSFEVEFVKLLEENGVEYDEKYLF